MTDIVAVTPDGQQHHFPEGTPDAAVDAAIKSYLQSTPADRSKWGAMEQVGNAVNQVGSGIYKGIAGLVGLPGTLSELGTAMDLPRGAGGVGGMPNPDASTVNQSPFPSGNEVTGFFKDELGIPIVEPETRADKFLQAGGTGAASVVLPGGALSNFVGGTAGGLTSEGAGQLTEGTALEPYARIAGGLVGGVTGSKLANMGIASNAEQLVSRATQRVTPQQWAAAMRLQADAATRGTPITSAEALAQIQGGNNALMSIQRNVEGMQETAPTMSQFMAQRPAANQAAAGQSMDQIAARALAPTEVGPRIQQGARGYIDDVRQDINLQTEPLYHLSQFDRIPPGEFARVSQRPAFQMALERVRNDPLLGADIAHMPDDSIAVVNAVKKEMDEMQAGFSAYGTEGYSPTRSAAVESGRVPLVDSATRASQPYDQALGIQATRRRAELLPAERAPIGKLAQTEDLSEQANILLPGSAMKASPEQIGGTVRELVNQGRAADVQALIRTKLQDVFASSAPNVKGTGEQYRGAQFANNVQKNLNTSAELEAAIRALPNGDTQWTGLRRLLDVFEAQGQRLPANSATSFNQQLREGMASNLGKNVKSIGIEMWARWNTQRRAEELARVLTAPEGVALLRQLAVIGPNTAKAQQLVQAFYQGAQAVERPRSLQKAP